MNLYRALDRTRVQFDFLVHTEETCAYDAEIEQLGGRIYHVQKINRGIVRYVQSIRAIVRDNHYDIVQVHTAHSAACFVLLAAKQGGARVRIAHSRNTFAELPWLHVLLRPFIRRLSTDRFACSKEAGQWMFGPHGDFLVKHNSIDVSTFCYDEDARDSLRAALDLEGRLVIGHIGRFAKAKNHSFLLEICSKLKEKQPDFRALLIGDGELREAIEQKAQELGLQENLMFLGPRGDVPKLMQAMDVFVFPSLFEGFGNVLVEAQAAGLPCIASDCITRETALTESMQYLPLSAGAQAWADAILSAHAKDRTQGAALVTAAGYDVHQEAQGFQRFYEEAAKRGDSQ